MTFPRAPYSPPLPSGALLRTGLHARGSHWRAVAELNNYLFARGQQLVCAHDPNAATNKTGSIDLYYKVWPTPRVHRLAWIFDLRRPATTNASSVTIELGIGSGLTYDVFAAFENPENPPLILWDESDGLGGEQEYSVRITNNGSNDLDVHGVSCVEVPRTILAADATDFGVNVDSNGPGEPIYDITANSYGGLIVSAAEVPYAVRRAGIFHWAVADGDNVGALSTTSASFVNPFCAATGGAHSALLGRRLSVSGGFATSKFAVRGAVSVAGTTGYARLTMTSGDQIFFDLNSTSVGWLTPTSTADIDHDSEDLTDARGREGGAADEITFELARTGGAGTIYVYGISGGEPAP